MPLPANMDDQSSRESRERVSPVFRTPGVDAMKNRIASRLFDAGAPPVTIGKFEIRGTIGSGGMGVVYRARDPVLGRDVALKLLHPRMAMGESEQARLMREAQALARLSHPNVVQLLEAGTHSGRVYLAMEYVRGPTLTRWQSEIRCGWRELLRSYLQAGAGLAAAHEAGFVHRDFKPDNCIVDERGRVRVLDFGLVRMSSEDAVVLEPTAGPERVPPSDPRFASPLTSPDTLLGTVAYMAPEQLRGGRVDAAADQFSFCVALFEALFGEQPFPGDSARQRALAFASTETPRPPRGHRVPASILRALRRGFSIDPNERWPSMSALLDVLERAARPRWTWWTGSLALSASLTIAAWGIWYPSSLRCKGVEQHLEGIWDDSRAAAVRDAFLASGSPIASTMWPRVEHRLAEYREEWILKHIDVCEATRMREEQSTEVMDQRMRCLDGHRRQLDATIDVLGRATPKVVLNAVDLASALPRLELCDDLRALSIEVAPPTNVVVEARVADLRDEFARINAAQGFETIDQRQVDALVQEAEELGYMPLVAEALVERGAVHENGGRFQAARADLWRANLLGLEYGHHRVQLRANERLASVVGFRLEQHEGGLSFAEAAVALAKQVGNEARIAAGYNYMGLINQATGDFESALELHGRALEIFERTLGPNHPNLGASMNGIGLVLLNLGRFSEAETVLGRALDARRSSLGEEHPDYAQTLGNLALVYKVQGRYQESEELRRRVLQVMRNALGDEHPRVASNLNNLGGVLVARGKYAEAEEVFRAALEIQRKFYEPGHPRIALTMHNIGAACDRRGKHEEAERLYREALKVRIDAFGEEHVSVALSLRNVGDLMSRKGELEEAEQLHLRALYIQEQALGTKHVQVARTLVGLAENALRSGRLVEARDWATRALEIRTVGEVSPKELAEARFLLSRVLGPDHVERARALAEDARRTYAEIGESGSKALVAVERWLATHPG